METKDLPDQQSVFKQLANYRKLKEYAKELDAIDNYLSAIARRNKAKQDEWIKEHPKAAKAGRAILRKLGNTGAGFGMEDVVARLLKRKELVEQKLTGRKIRRKPVAAKKEAPPAKQQQAAAAKAAREQERKKKIQLEIERKAAAQQRKKTCPSLFVISLHYKVALEKIDSAMQLHLAYLDKYYKAGNFMVSGRKSPRTGGIIIAKGKNRSAIEKIVAQDPFIKKKLATADIIEFWASRSTKDFQRLL